MFETDYLITLKTLQDSSIYSMIICFEFKI